MVDLDRSINVARKSGKTSIGAKSAIKAAKLGKAKAIIVAANAPADQMEDVLYYAKLSGVPIIDFPRTSQDLGIICGRPHLTSFVTVFSAGDSDILEAIN
ncbi:MAG: 50S ribosomal protein L30e [Candidatus Heimdallarchaeota archaeon LC_2]|nr:MAG: 50S ribosomal protein L30e [Candidatus Heimdallarchaeota archaeon LC_2]